MDLLLRCDYTHFYPRSPCGERHKPEFSPIKPVCISIHALLAESDNLDITIYLSNNPISIHALLAESDIVSLLPRAGSRISIHALLAESDNNRIAI